MDGDWRQCPPTVPAQQEAFWGLNLKLPETRWRGWESLGVWLNRAGMHLFHGKIKRQLGRISLLLGLSQELGPGLEVADTECAGGVSLMPPATEGVICDNLPAWHQRHLVLQDGCFAANDDVVWWSNENFSSCQPQTFLENLGPVLCHIQGNGAVTGWIRKPFLPWYQTLTAYPCGAPEDQAHAWNAFWKSRMEAMKGITTLSLILAF